MDLHVFAKSVWDVHCGIHTVRTMFNTEKIAQISHKIKFQCPGASIEGWVPKYLRKPQQQMSVLSNDPDTAQKSEESGSERELTEEEEEAKLKEEKNYTVSVTVAEWFQVLDAEYEVTRILDRELEGLSKKELKRTLKKRKKQEKMDADFFIAFSIDYYK